MILYFHRQYAIKFDDDFEVIGLYGKGKKKQYSISDYRLHLRGIKFKQEYLFWFDEHPLLGVQAEYIPLTNRITPIDNFKFKNYNYYPLPLNNTTVHKILQFYKDHIHLVPVFAGSFQDINTVPGYTHTYMYDGVKY